jgi:hypothetical protein
LSALELVGLTVFGTLAATAGAVLVGIVVLGVESVIVLARRKARIQR